VKPPSVEVQKMQKQGYENLFQTIEDNANL
jgi:hypothetical protein